MSKKSKSKSNSIADLHFISSLQLEQSVQLLGNLADEQHHITFSEVDENQFQFEIDYLDNHKKQARIKGTLQRWQGTETKLDADGRVDRLEISDPNFFNRPIASAVLIATAGINIALVTSFPALVVPFVLGVAGYGYYVRRQLDETKTIQTVLFRHRDYLLQLLIDTFKAHGDVRPI
ncbi:MAG: hypothetical protein AAF846_04245 [Chloroflexota bacterium]